MDQATLKIQLRNLIEWREAYYNGTPLVTDAVYDDVEDQVREAAKALPEGDKMREDVEEFLSRVGAPVVGGDDGDDHWEKVKHTHPMGSLNKAQISDEVLAWFDKCLAAVKASGVNVLATPTPIAVWSDKCDGISIGLDYADGKMVRAATRGDGEVGEDITRNVRKMKGVVPFIKGFTGFIRGEIVLRKTDWLAHFPTYANPRNAASGIAKRLDGVGCEHLTVLHYQMVRTSGQAIPNKLAQFKIMEHLGCAMPSFGSFDSVADVAALYERYIDGDRDALDYLIDGLVLEFNDPAAMDALGEHNLRPRGGVAYKFPHEQKVTTLRDIEWQVGNTGRVTPVAVFDPVNLAGATIKQASLHTVARVEGLKLWRGCSIVVSRRNDVIPMVEKNLSDGISIHDI